jgi:hypothetical protein
MMCAGIWVEMWGVKGLESFGVTFISHEMSCFLHFS